jgi:hypothetical protein
VLNARADAGPGRFEELEVEQDHNGDDEQIAHVGWRLHFLAEGERRNSICVAAQSHGVVSDDNIEDPRMIERRGS